MWYFVWIFGVGLVCIFVIFNVMWFEFWENDVVVDDIVDC